MDTPLKNKRSFSERLSYMIRRGRGAAIETDLSRYWRTLEKIRSFDFSNMGDSRLQALGPVLKKRVLEGGCLDELLPEAYALVAEACRRIVGQDPFAVQLIAAEVLHQGKLAQMNTGEGKTLAAVFPAYLNALTGKGVHVMTANDYLARRDARWMGQIYNFLSVSVGSVQENMPDEERTRMYRRDITYLTAKQGGFDFLKDQIQYDRKQLIQRDFHMAIVDEADFIMIDEARIPLVIAAETESEHVDPNTINRLFHQLDLKTDCTVDRQGRKVSLTLKGQQKVAHIVGCGGIHEKEWQNTYAAVHVALHAHILLKKDVDYLVKNGRIELIDEFTGRVADKRRWPYGIQTALEAKEGLPLQPQGKICGSITVQNFISQYPRLAAMTATAESAAEEFQSFYGLATVIIPPNRPDKLERGKDRIFTTKKAKLSALVEEINTVHQTGRPILVGTRSVRESRELAGILVENEIPCKVLNADNDEMEAELVAQAGRLKAVTISTNMAGRGTDIMLGGESGEERGEILTLGGLYVIGTNRHESVRIDNQLAGRAGRQGDPGFARFFISLEDELFQRYGIADFIPDRYLKGDDTQAISDERVHREVERAQGIIEGQHFQIRRTLRKYSELVEIQRRKLQDLRRDALNRETGSDRALLYYLDEFWREHLAFIDDLREGIHLQRYGGREPILEFIREVSAAFGEGIEKAVRMAEAGRSLSEAEKFKGPSGTWTYLIDDNPLPRFSLALIASSNIGYAALSAVQGLVYLPILLFSRKRGSSAGLD